MALDNSTIQHPLPGDLQARVENALNLVTSLEAEHARLEKMIGSQRQQINANHEEIKSCEGQLKTCHKSLDGILTNIDAANDKLNTLNYAIKDANHELEEANRQKIEITNFVAQQKSDLDARVAKVTELENGLNERIKAHTENESAHQKKVERLLEAIK